MAVPVRHLPRVEQPEVNDGPGRPLKELLARSRTRARRFLAQFSDLDTPAREAMRATDFLEAAIHFAETYGGSIEGRVVNVTVTDCETGERHCFALNV